MKIEIRIAFFANSSSIHELSSQLVRLADDLGHLREGDGLGILEIDAGMLRAKEQALENFDDVSWEAMWGAPNFRRRDVDLRTLQDVEQKLTS